MIFKTQEGQQVVLKPHLLRHTFATHAVQVEKIPIDIVGQWLKQKNLDVTDYYSQPTESMVAEAADRYLSRVAVVFMSTKPFSARRRNYRNCTMKPEEKQARWPR